MKKNSSCKVKYRRILLKLSGEVLGNKSTGECIDPKNLAFMAEHLAGKLQENPAILDFARRFLHAVKYIKNPLVRQ